MRLLTESDKDGLYRSRSESADRTNRDLNVPVPLPLDGCAPRLV